ncbi:MAG: hypothetical protein RLZZ501_1051, partial [Pseudomonadota bacterium]
FDTEQLRHRGMVATLPHPLGGSVRTVANPIKLSATPVAYDRPPPLLGADTAGLLQEVLGLEEDEIAALAACGAIGCG